MAGVSVGLVDDKIVLNPNAEEREKSTLNLTVAGTAEKVCFDRVAAPMRSPRDTMLEAIITGHKEIQKMCAFLKGCAV